MNNLAFTFLLLLTTYLSAQPPNGRDQRQNLNRQFTGEQKMEMPKATDIAGVFYYDVKKVIKKLKIKNDEAKVVVSKALKEYNFKIKEISFLNKDNFKALDILMKPRRGMRRMPKDGKNFQNDDDIDNDENRGYFRQKIGKIIRPIRRDIQENELVLNTVLNSVLSAKQNKKWLKYQKQQKEKLKPKRPERNNSGGQRQGQMGGQRRGF